MIGLYFSKINEDLIKAEVIDDITSIGVISFNLSRSRYNTIKNYIDNSSIKFGSTYIEPSDSLKSYTILFFNDNQYLKICEQYLINRFVNREIIINYEKIYFLE